MKDLKYSTKRAISGYLFIMPWLIGFIVLTAYPTIYSLYLSFHKVKITATESISTKFIGFDNFKHAFLSDVSFTDTLLSFLFQLILSVPIIIVFALIISLLINSNIRLKGFFRTIFFLPVIITSGPVIHELMEQGATSIPALKDTLLIDSIVGSLPKALGSALAYVLKNIIMILWFSGIQILIFLAGLQKIDESVYEAAQIDGASRWEAFWKITLPAIQSMILANVIYTVVSISIFSLNPVIKLIQENMFKVETGFGYASALSWIYFIMISLVLALGSSIVLSKEKKYNE